MERHCCETTPFFFFIPTQAIIFATNISYMLFFILLSFSAVVSWFRFFPKDASSDRNNAVLLLAVIVLFMFLYSSSISLFGYMISNTAEWKKTYLAGYGLIPAWLHATQYILHVAAGLVAVVATLIMARYKNSGRV